MCMAREPPPPPRPAGLLSPVAERSPSATAIAASGHSLSAHSEVGEIWAAQAG